MLPLSTATSATIDALPEELLNRTMELVVHSEETTVTLVAAVRLMGVCRHWRHVAKHNGALWTRLELDLRLCMSGPYVRRIHYDRVGRATKAFEDAVGFSGSRTLTITIYGHAVTFLIGARSSMKSPPSALELLLHLDLKV